MKPQSMEDLIKEIREKLKKSDELNNDNSIIMNKYGYILEMNNHSGFYYWLHPNGHQIHWKENEEFNSGFKTKNEALIFIEIYVTPEEKHIYEFNKKWEDLVEKKEG